MAVSGDEQGTEATKQEIKLGEQSNKELEKYFTILVNPVHQARVETIVGRLRPYMERNLSYDVRIADHEMINAFALAGGTMYVTTGMLEFVKTDLELAGVIAHEMVHADRKHVIIQMARNERMTLLAILAAIASRGQGAALLAANALQVAVMGAYSIDIEKEADAYGIDALTKAGYNPVGVLTLQERLQEENMKRAYVDPGIAATHPDTKERVAAAVKYMEDRDLPVHRKYSLGVLRSRVEAVSGDLILYVDDHEIWRGRETSETRTLFERVSADLWRFLQMETAPYDIRVEGFGRDQALQIKSRTIVRSRELPEGAESLTSLRERIHEALSSARRNHPLADYYL